MNQDAVARAAGAGYNARMEEETEGVVRAGPAGWSYEDWKGIVYPPDMPRSLHPLTLLSAFFDTVEVNSTFYRPTQPRYCLSWLEKVRENPRFMFTVKLWQRFTHQRDAWPGPEDVRTYCEGIQPLVDAGKLGVLLVQFPWSFKRSPENRKWLAQVAETFAEYTLAVELRHTSWLRGPFFEGLAQRKIAFCNIDQPIHDDSIGPSDHVTAPTGYIRLHGRNKADWFREGAGRNARYDYLYSQEELEPWIDKIKKMRKRVNDLFIITNNHYRGQAVVNAIEIQAAIGQAKYTLPKSILDAYPRLRGLMKAEGA